GIADAWSNADFCSLSGAARGKRLHAQRRRNRHHSKPDGRQAHLGQGPARNNSFAADRDGRISSAAERPGEFPQSKTCFDGPFLSAGFG
ncbi:hypothetical protein, partial [Mesorhizobium sp.]|uniref:hypothetical protein n=1 Tax=Mesorhizobium sp. TaxID=1871066 RepID=UPI0025C6BCFB